MIDVKLGLPDGYTPSLLAIAENEIQNLHLALEAAQARIKKLEADVVRRESERNEIGAKVDELYMMLAYRATQPPEQDTQK